MNKSPHRRRTYENLHLHETRQNSIREANKIHFFLIAASILIAVGLFVATIFLKAPEKKEVLAPQNITVDGAFHILSDGSVDTQRTNLEKANKIVIVTDFHSPSAAVLENKLGQHFINLSKDKMIDYYIVPVNFLKQYSSDNYSKRAFNAITTVAEYSPRHFNDFYIALMKNQPAKGESLTDEDLVDLALEVGISERVSKIFEENLYGEWITLRTNIILDSTSMLSGDNSIPTVIITDENNTEAAKVNFTTEDNLVKDFYDQLAKISSKEKE